MTRDRDHTKIVLFAAAAVLVLSLLGRAIRSLIAGPALHPSLASAFGVPTIVNIALVSCLCWYVAEPYWRAGCLIVLLGTVSALATAVIGANSWVVSGVLQLAAAALSGSLFAVSWFKDASRASGLARKESMHWKILILCTLLLAVVLILLLYGLG